MINREDLKATVRTAIRRAQVTTVLGLRQCGKTTIAREIGGEAKAEFFDLEDPVSRKRLEEPMIALSGLKGLVVIDEAQRMPELFPVLRVLSDRTPLPARFLLTGSASPDLIQGVSETLAGRVEFIEMSGFGLSEVGPEALRRLWWRGLFRCHDRGCYGKHAEQDEPRYTHENCLVNRTPTAYRPGSRRNSRPLCFTGGSS